MKRTTGNRKKQNNENWKKRGNEAKHVIITFNLRKNVKLYKTRKENLKCNVIIRGKQTKSRKNLQEQYGVDIPAIKINN